MSRPGTKDEPVNRVFRDRLVEAIEHKGDKRVETAAALQVTTKAVQSWTTGRNLPNGTALIRLCLYLDCSADWLLGLGGEDTSRSTTPQEA